MVNRRDTWFAVLVVGLILAGCATHRKIANLGSEQVDIYKKDLADFLPDETAGHFEPPQEIVTTDEAGNRVILMAARLDEETGEMEATDVLEAAVVTARFQNRAERAGKIDLEFRIWVPYAMLDKDWEMTLVPRMTLLGETTDMDPVVITGEAFRRRQERGYERYRRFLDSIVTDSLDLTWRWQLEEFIQRNIPELYAMRTDSSYVTEEAFWGVNGMDAVRHYMNRLRQRQNQRKITHKEDYFHAFVPSPYQEGVRSDTVLTDLTHPYIYDYFETVDTRPKLRKIDVTLVGDIRRDGKLIYKIPCTDTLTFYVSSLSSFAKDIVRYKKEIIYRQQDESVSRNIIFPLGKAALHPELGDNAEEIHLTEQSLRQLMVHDQLVLDSLVIRANSSPDGPFQRNLELSAQRSASVSSYFSRFMNELRDSLIFAQGYTMDSTGVMRAAAEVPLPSILSIATPENWDGLDELVAVDTLFTEADRERYARLRKEMPEDRRDYMMSRERFGRHLREDLYPRLRRVQFDFFMHRKGMVKDTVETTVIDSVYIRGLEALRDRDYQTAIELLAPYKDYNTAVAYLAMDRNQSALDILKKQEQTSAVKYMMAILLSRLGQVEAAVNSYLEACRADHSYISRGNLDPEISMLIKRYRLNSQPDEEDFLL